MQIEQLPIFTLFVGSCAAFRLLFGSWLTPPAFCALYWTIFIGLNLFFPEYPMLTDGLLYILASMWFFAIAHLIVSVLRPPARQPVMSWTLSSGLFRVSLIISIVLGLTYVIVVQGSGIVTIEGVSWAVQLLLVNHFSGPIVVGLLLGGQCLRRADRYLSALVLLPALTLSILYTGRTAFFGPLVMLGTGYLAGTVLVRPHRTPLFSWFRVSMVVVGLFLSSVYGTAIYVMRLARGAEDFGSTREKVVTLASAFDPETWAASYNTMRSHVYGQPSTFSAMFRDYYSNPSFVPSYGKFTFAGPLVLIGIERMTHEVFLTSDNVETNVYTIFAPAIEDFGLMGSFAWWLIVGAISALAYRASQRGSFLGAAIVAIIIMNLQIGACFLFRYNSVNIGYALVVLACWQMDRMKNREKRLLQGAVAEAGASHASMISWKGR